MEIKVIRVPQFMSKKVNVIMVDGKPLCTCRGNFTTQSIIARLQGYDVEIKDGRILKLIESEKEQDNGNDW
jgi:hypothetical protein